MKSSSNKKQSLKKGRISDNINKSDVDEFLTQRAYQRASDYANGKPAYSIICTKPHHPDYFRCGCGHTDDNSERFLQHLKDCQYYKDQLSGKFYHENTTGQKNVTLREDSKLPSTTKSK